MRKAAKKRAPRSKTFTVIGDDGQVTMVTRTIVPASEIPSFEKFNKSNEMLKRAIMLSD